MAESYTPMSLLLIASSNAFPSLSFRVSVERVRSGC